MPTKWLTLIACAGIGAFTATARAQTVDVAIALTADLSLTMTNLNCSEWLRSSRDRPALLTSRSGGPDKAAAPYVDKILKGEKAADLPIDQASRFEFVVNMRTAKMLGIDMPISVSGFADQVIE